MSTQLRHPVMQRFCLLLACLLALAGLQVIGVQRADAVDTFNGGWTQPLGSMSGLSSGFLANNCGYSGYGSYIPGKYHIANDYGKAAGTAVYSIGDGTVVSVQVGWPGAAVFIKHEAADGTQFLGVYGHINNSVGNGATVTAGQQIGTVYNDGGNSHLHFGIRAATTPATSNNGSMPCSSWPSGNGYVNPLPYLSAHPVTSLSSHSTFTPGVTGDHGNGVIRWDLRNSNTSGAANVSFTYGMVNVHVPVVGDWDGDGDFTPGVVSDNGNGVWKWELRNSNSTGGANTVFTYGMVGIHTPVVGDWNG